MTVNLLFISHENCVMHGIATFFCNLFQRLTVLTIVHEQTSHAVSVWCVICPTCAMIDKTFTFVFVFDLSFGQTILLDQLIVNKNFTFTCIFNMHSLIKCAVLHFVPFDCQSAGLIAVGAVLPFVQISTLDIAKTFLLFLHTTSIWPTSIWKNRAAWWKDKKTQF